VIKKLKSWYPRGKATKNTDRFDNTMNEENYRICNEMLYFEKLKNELQERELVMAIPNVMILKIFKPL
jgi:hypothetical protein